MCHPTTFNLENERKLKENLKVSVGEYSLIRPDLNEQIITVLAMFMFEGYNSESKLHDIALVEV